MSQVETGPSELADSPSVLPAGVSALWRHTRGDDRICIAVLDGPVDFAHPCFADADLTPIRGQGAAGSLGGGSMGGQASRHGTHVASLIFGGHGSSIQGIAPRCRGVIDNVYGERDDGSVVPCSQLDLARAIVRAVGYGAQIINISGGQLDDGGEAQLHLTRAVQLCADNDVLLITSAGNDGCNCAHVPGAIPTVLVVGAMDRAGMPLDFSNWSDTYQDHGILAPGENIPGAAPGGGVALQTGTSFATAIVSGVAGLLMSLQLRHGGKTDSRAIRQAILHSAVSCDQQPVADCRRLLSGRLNLPAAVSQLSLGVVISMSEPQNPIESASAAGNRVERYLENGAAARQVGKEIESHEAAPAISPVQSPSPRVGAASPPPAPAAETPAKSATKSGCGCGGGCSTKPPNTVYTLGQIGFDFGTEARRDSFIQQGVQHPGNPLELLAHLDENPWAAAAVTWILVQETTPVYAIQPAGAFAQEAYNRLRSFMRGQIEEGISQVSIGGIEAGSTRLLNGQEVPLIVPEIRSMYSWSTPALVEAVLGARPDNGQDCSHYDQQAEEVGNFLDRVYYEISNLGVAPQERAINYAATNAYQVATVYRDAIKQSLKLDNIGVERSSVCRPGSDCWDVRLTFFDPSQRHEKAKEVYRFTVDVSERVPVTVGKVRRWSAY